MNDFIIMFFVFFIGWQLGCVTIIYDEHKRKQRSEA